MKLQVSTQLLTLLLRLAGNDCAPLTPQTSAKFGSGSEMVQRIGLQRGDGAELTWSHLSTLKVKNRRIF